MEKLDRLSRDYAMMANELLRRLLTLGLTVVTGQDREIQRPGSDRDIMSMIFSTLAFERAHEESLTKQKRVFCNVAALVERHNRCQSVNIKSAGSSPWWIDDTGSRYEETKPHLYTGQQRRR